MRKLASIQTIRALTPIEGADAIELAHVNGWSSVVKKGEHEVGDTVIFCEIDSWIPHALAPFLSKGKEPREYMGVKGERLRSMKMRGQLSQGLILPYSTLTPVSGIIPRPTLEGEDVTEVLGILKYEPPVPLHLSGTVKGNFPAYVSKTDEERVQNIKGLVELLDTEFVQTEKLHGTSVSFVLNSDNEMEVCSRNLSLKEDPDNFYWRLAESVNARWLLEYVKEYMKEGYKDEEIHSVAIQGEGVGRGVQKGWEYGMMIPEFFMFTIQVNGARISEEDFSMFCWKFKRRGVKYAPVITVRTLRDLVGDCETTQEIREELLELVEGKSILDGKTIREGSVFRSVRDSSFSFKAVSNQFLLKGGE